MHHYTNSQPRYPFLKETEHNGNQIATGTTSKTQLLRELKAQLDSGKITSVEYEKKKAEVLDSMSR